MMRRFGAHGCAGGPDRPGRSGAGQATVEVALVLPLLAVIALAVVQVGLIVHARVMVTHAAREAVRVAAVGGTDASVERAAASAGGLDPSRLEVTVAPAHGRVHVRISYAAATDVPLLGGLVGTVPLTASASMRLE